jgi:hypothetical protein
MPTLKMINNQLVHQLLNPRMKNHILLHYLFNSDSYLHFAKKEDHERVISFLKYQFLNKYTSSDHLKYSNKQVLS